MSRICSIEFESSDGLIGGSLISFERHLNGILSCHWMSLQLTLAETETAINRSVSVATEQRAIECEASPSLWLPSNEFYWLAWCLSRFLHSHFGCSIAFRMASAYLPNETRLNKSVLVESTSSLVRWQIKHQTLINNGWPISIILGPI